MKSYLKFLSRNRLYTVIEFAGLAVSLAFVIIIGCYTLSMEGSPSAYSQGRSCALAEMHY